MKSVNHVDPDAEMVSKSCSEEGESEETSEEDDTMAVSVSVSDQTRREEIDQLRRAQMAAVKNEVELGRRTVGALRREAEERVDQFRRSAQEEKEIRRGDAWWTDMMKRRPTIAHRVLATVEMALGRKKITEAKKLWGELEDRRRLLAMARSMLAPGKAGERTLEEALEQRQSNGRCQGHDRSCPSCGNGSMEDTDEDWAAVEGEPTAAEVQTDPRANGGAGSGRRTPRSGRKSPRRPNSPRTVRRAQQDQDYLMALALQRAEFQGARYAGAGAGRQAADAGANTARAGPGGRRFRIL